VVGAAFVALGLAFLFGTPVVNRSASAVSPFPLRLRRPPLPSIFGTPSGAHPVVGPVVPPNLQLAGLVLLLVGLAGLGALLWIWRPWSPRPGGTSGFDQNVGMPNFL
jgi:hypothetical protein